MTLEANADEHRHRQAVGLGIDIDAVTANDATILENAQPAQTGRRRQVDLRSQVLIGDPAVLLQSADNLTVLAIHIAVPWNILPLTASLTA